MKLSLLTPFGMLMTKPWRIPAGMNPSQSPAGHSLQWDFAGHSRILSRHD
jgi:hypothetical protein